MAVIGEFKPSRTGGWEGDIRTLCANAKVRLEPNDNRNHPNAPAFRVMTGSAHLGDAWEHRSRGDAPRTYYRVSLDDPFLDAPIWATLFLDAESLNAQLVWTRPPKPKERSPSDSKVDDPAPKASLQAEVAEHIQS